MTISQRIFMLLKEKRLKQKDLADFTGISTSAISAWNKNNVNPAAENLSTIADFLGVSLNFLITGHEEQLDVPEDINKLIVNYSAVDDISKKLIQERAETLAELAAERAAEQAKKAAESVPSSADERPTPQKPLPFPSKQEPNQDEEEEEYCYIDVFIMSASAGTGVYLSDDSKEPIKIVRTDIAERANYAIRVSGDSMIPKYNDGDIVLVETCQCVDVGEIGIFIVNGEGYIKKFGGDHLISLNPKRKNIIFHEGDSVYCRGRVLGVAEVVE